jgi:hypothetical protein
MVLVNSLLHRGMVCAGALSLGALGCSAEIERYSSDADTGSSTHALISIRRSVSVDHPGSAKAEALVGFVRVPAELEARPLYELLGLRTAVPAAGQCRLEKSTPDAAPALAELGKIELLDAGDVELGAAGSTTALAPHAFPTVTDSISGVVYATRDRSSGALPSRASYLVRTSGSPELAAINVERDAPAELDSVTVGGSALGELREVSRRDPIDLTWGVGAPGDLVLVELSSADGAVAATCAFKDENGAGTIPAGTLPAAGAGRVSLHRVRSAQFSAHAIDVGEIEFDFELGTKVTFTQ